MITNQNDDYLRGYGAGYDDSRAGRWPNSTIHKLSRTFRVGYYDGFDTYTGEALRCHHEETEVA